jgi:NAD(P)-dependent dehydrogenase (short-subunit alcohol dehydrogenase family)
MSEITRWARVVIASGHDVAGRALVDCFLAMGSRVLVIDLASLVKEMPEGVEVVGLPDGLSDAKLGQAVQKAIEQWGTPDLLVNNFSDGFLQKSQEVEEDGWDWGAQPAIRIGLAATVAYAGLRQPGAGDGVILNVGMGIGLIPHGCPMHFSLLGLMRSLGLAKMGHLKVANLCMHNLDAARPECAPCAEQVLMTNPQCQPGELREKVRRVLEHLG